ncbi:MAG: c-type cytochrome [Halothiobacillaceae bacterium]
MLRTASLIAAALMLGAAASTHAATPSGQTIGFTCLACHGAAGQGSGAIPPLAGRPADTLYQALIDYKTGKRPATIMNRHAKGYSDEELRAVANYFSAMTGK